eukprot:m.449832 g.449832  ORF g.449832 m.449832 type:complete len:1359 (-) comp56904_c0_seq3:122-4198(-)
MSEGALASSTLSALHALSVHSLPQHLVESIFQDSFSQGSSEGLELPARAEAIEPLNDLLSALNEWAALAQQQQPAPDQPQFWVLLAENMISGRALLSTLHFYLTTEDSEQPDSTRFTAAAAYLALLRVPGSLAYSMFQNALFATVCKLLRTSAVEPEAPRSQPGKKTKRTKSSSSSKMNITTDENSEDEDSRSSKPSSQQSNVQGSTAEVAEALRQLTAVLALQFVQKDETSSLLAIETLFDHLAVLNESDASSAMTSRSASQSSVARYVYEGLVALLQQENTAKLMFKHIIQFLSFKNEGPTKTAVKLANLCVTFVKSICSSCTFYGDLTRMLVQHTCMQAPEKADPRAKTTALLAQLVEGLPLAARVGVFSWIGTISRNSKVNLRAVAVDVSFELFQTKSNEFHRARDQAASEDEFASYLSLIDIIASRCSDKVASLRGKALGNLAACFDVARSNDQIKILVDHVLLPKMESLGDSETDHEDLLQESMASANITSVSANFLTLLRKRITDVKSNVRKSAVQALTAIAVTAAESVGHEDLDAIKERCLDPALSVRKQALMSLTDILLCPGMSKNTRYHEVWLEGTLSLVMDREESVAVKCAEVYGDILWDSLFTSDKIAASRAWSFLKLIDAQPLRRQYVNRLCTAWQRENRLRPQVVANLTREICSRSAGGWVLLSEIACLAPASIPLEQVLHVCSSMDYQQPEALSAFTILANILANMQTSSTTIAGLIERLKADISGFTIPPQLVSVVLRIVTGAEDKQKTKHKGIFAEQLLELSCDRLSQISALDQYESQQTANLLFTLGETASFCPQRVTQTVVEVVQVFVASSLKFDDSKPRYDSFVRAHAFTALGKMCLQCEDLAKTCLPLMVKELSTCHDDAVKNNIVVIMADLCVRYTTVMDNYVSCFVARLQDSSALVRKTTLTLITRLFSEDFIKMKSSILMPLLLTLVDTDTAIRSLGEFSFQNIILVKQPAIFATNFVECIFFLNGLSADAATKLDKTSAITGEQNSKRRSVLYAFMLEHSAEMDKLSIAQRLCQEILGGVVDGKLPLQSFEDVLRDVFSILISKEIKLKSQRSTAVADDGEDEPEDAAKAKQARTTMITKIMKKNTAENILPITIALKNMFESKHSPLLRDVLLYIRDLMKEYKEEIEELLSADRQLASEIKFDIQKLENEAKQQKAARDLQLSFSQHQSKSTASTAAPTPQLSKQTSMPASMSPYISPAMLTRTPQTPFSAPRLRNDSALIKASPIAAAKMAPPQSTTAGTSSTLPMKSAQQDLQWVRTPARKLAEASQSPVIRLQSPLVQANVPPTRWNVSAPVFESPLRQKRSAAEHDENDSGDTFAQTRARTSTRSFRS